MPIDSRGCESPRNCAKHGKFFPSFSVVWKGYHGNFMLSVVTTAFHFYVIFLNIAVYMTSLLSCLLFVLKHNM